jgi:hypothetical protein
LKENGKEVSSKTQGMPLYFLNILQPRRLREREISRKKIPKPTVSPVP